MQLHYIGVILEYILNYAGREKNSPQRPPFLTQSDLDRLGVSFIPLTMANYAKSAVFGSKTKWAALTSFLDDGQLLSSTVKQQIFQKGNTWDGSTDFGSYTILFQTSYVYSGKGGGKIRCEQSANNRCSSIPEIADFQKSSTSYIMNFSSTTERQAYKEEAVRMYQSGFQNSNVLNDDSYNLNQSPGKNYISIDGF